jgi:hypothetical protein
MAILRIRCAQDVMDSKRYRLSPKFFGNGADLVGFSSPSLLTIGPASTTQWKRYILILGNQTEIRLNSGKFSPIEAVRGA